MNKFPIALLALFPLAVVGQTKQSVSTTWDKTITVVPDQLLNGKFRLAAYTVSIFETDGSTALDLLRTEYRSISTQVSGSNPLKAVGCVLPAIDAAPLLVLARSETDKKANLARLTIAFAVNDSTAATNTEAMQTTARNVAVRLNRAVVGRQIQAQEKLLNDTRNKQQQAQASAAENQRKVDAANAEIANIQAKKGRLEAERSGIEHDIQVLDDKYKRSNDEKDLDKLNKARKRLAGNGTEISKLAQDEAKEQGSISKYQGNIGQANANRDIHAANIEKQQQVLESLRLKLEAIQ